MAWETERSVAVEFEELGAGGYWMMRKFTTRKTDFGDDLSLCRIKKDGADAGVDLVASEQALGTTG